METNPYKNKVHKVLTRSYSVYFLFLLIGIYFSLIFHFKIFNSSIVLPLGFLLLILATFLILWAQKTSRNLQKEKMNKETFFHGPYCFTRNPTHLGLFLLMLGFGLILNSFFITLFSFIYLVFGKVVFLAKEEKILAEKYGAPYLEYKKSVRF